MTVPVAEAVASSEAELFNANCCTALRWAAMVLSSRPVSLSHSDTLPTTPAVQKTSELECAKKLELLQADTLYSK